MTQPLSSKERQFLLSFARKTIEHAARGESSSEPAESDMTARLWAPGAAFVTLHTRAGDLRGCIGSLVAHRALIDDVRANALAAAFEDPRFSPVTLREMPDLVVEISVLTAPEPLVYQGPEDLVCKLRPGIDGVILERGWNRATFLPQVWEQLPEPEEFLAHLCYKAGLSPNTWRSHDLKVSIYQVEEFHEETL